jgi:hypothetical protein
MPDAKSLLLSLLQNVLQGGLLRIVQVQAPCKYANPSVNV